MVNFLLNKQDEGDRISGIKAIHCGSQAKEAQKEDVMGFKIR
jgi:hypothetical protein